MTGKGRSQNKSKREEEARSRGFVGPDRESWVDAALSRASRRLQKKTQPPRRSPSPWTGERDRESLGMTHTRKNHRPGERREKRYAGSEWLQKDQKQDRQQKRA